MTLQWPAPGTLTVYTEDGERHTYSDVSTFEAQAILDAQWKIVPFRDAIYQPYAINMELTK